jgi:hypothetical protein
MRTAKVTLSIIGAYVILRIMFTIHYSFDTLLCFQSVIYKIAAAMPPNAKMAGNKGAAVAMAIFLEPEEAEPAEPAEPVADPLLVVELETAPDDRPVPAPVPVVEAPPDFVAAVADPVT